MYQNSTIINTTGNANRGESSGSITYWSLTESSASSIWILALSKGQNLVFLKLPKTLCVQ